MAARTFRAVPEGCNHDEPATGLETVACFGRVVPGKSVGPFRIARPALMGNVAARGPGATANHQPSATGQSVGLGNVAAHSASTPLRHHRQMPQPQRAILSPRHPGRVTMPSSGLDQREPGDSRRTGTTGKVASLAARHGDEASPSAPGDPISTAPNGGWKSRISPLTRRPSSTKCRASLRAWRAADVPRAVVATGLARDQCRRSPGSSDPLASAQAQVGGRRRQPEAYLHRAAGRP